MAAAGRRPMPVSCSRSCHCPEAYVAGSLVLVAPMATGTQVVAT